MIKLNIFNPFAAPVYYEETVTSTMDISRRLAKEGEPHGAVIVADFQKNGRGRIKDRVWEMEGGVSLPFTIMLRYLRLEDIPSAITLRAGLAVSLAIEDFAPSLAGKVKVKWPNDIMIGGKKCAGILSEAADCKPLEDCLSSPAYSALRTRFPPTPHSLLPAIVYIGIGINVGQKEFPAHLREKATSIALATGIGFKSDDRFLLLEKVLQRLYGELQMENGAGWKSRLEQRLYKKGEQVVFIDGEAGCGKKTSGRLTGIGCDGELLVVPDGETEPCSFIAGELALH